MGDSTGCCQGKEDDCKRASSVHNHSAFDTGNLTRIDGQRAGGGPLAALLRVFVVGVHSHHHPVWLATRVRGVDAWVTAYDTETKKTICLLTYYNTIG